MKFYKELSRVYDIVFPKDEQTLKFLLKDLRGNSKVIDLACGTGTYTLALALKGHRMDAVDLGEEMIQLARGKAGLYANFAVGDMTKVKDIFPRERYDLAYCIGNSIVHLKSKDKIQEFIKDIYDVLAEDGKMVVQIVNYDRIIKHDIKSLPTISRPEKGIEFTRNYSLDENEEKIQFKTELVVKRGDKEEVYENSVDLIALKKDELVAMFDKAGFKGIKVFGGFSEEELNNESFALVIKGIKVQ